MNIESKPTILFVDDEENVLSALGRMLRSRRNTWDLRFALGGQEALNMLAQQPADVIVTDMKMPGMDGSELLRIVQKKYPGSIRIVLSGFAEREAILKTIGPSHRYLAKPSSEAVLVTSIENALTLRAHIQDQKVKEAVASLSHLPTLPKIYAEILAELTAEHGSAESLSAKIEQDISVSAQLMKLTNSAYFSLPQKCRTARQAVMFLGFDNVRAVVLLAGVFDQFKHLGPSAQLTIERLSQNSLSIGVLAQAIARHQGWSADIVDQAFCAGLLSHVGTLILIAHDATKFSDMMAQVDNRQLDLLDAETQAFGANHAQLGAYLLGLWGFSDVITETVAFHHQPSIYTKAPLEVLTAVHAAQNLTRQAYGKGGRAGQKSSDWDTEYLSAHGLSQRLPEWQKILETISKEWPNE